MRVLVWSVAAACGLAAALIAPLSAMAEAEAARGRLLFEGGEGSGLKVKAGKREIPARGISCAGCHGRDAEGGAEIQSGPAIRWQGLREAGYDQDSFAHALKTGIRPDGTLIGGAMPRFSFSEPGDPAALADYLAQIGTIQRAGLDGEKILLGRGSEVAAAQPFWRAFQDRLDRLAPNGIFGRELALTRDDGAFVSIGALKADGVTETLRLFPLITLVGDEDPTRIRGGYATVVAQILAATAYVGPIQLLANPGLTNRLRPLLPDAQITYLDHPRQVNPVNPVMVLDPVDWHELPDSMKIISTVDNIARLDTAPSRCLTATDPHPVPPSDETPLARYGRVAATALVEALKRCGADCTRARLIDAFDGLHLAGDDWLELDYGTHRLTGTDEVAIWSLCDGQARRQTP